jgi:dUTP pyrophosphatase
MKDIEVELKIKKDSPEAVLPEIAYSNSSACFDLYSVVEKEIKPNDTEDFDVGLRIIVPNGYYLRFNTRSGHGFKKKLRCHPGIIDAGYTGPLHIKVFNFGNEAQTIKKGEAVVQVELLKIIGKSIKWCSETEWKEYEEKSSRKDGSLGSSNKI